MALRRNHYDAAFEGYLRCLRIPYVAVDESRRALVESASLRSMDFIVYSSSGQNLLIDVKGRRFPSGNLDAGQRWQSWAERDSVQSLTHWQSVFGDSFRGLLLFSYHIAAPRLEHLHHQRFLFRDRLYSFYGVFADDYRAAMKPRSSKWDTVYLPRKTFRDICHPIDSLLGDDTGWSKINSLPPNLPAQLAPAQSV